MLGSYIGNHLKIIFIFVTCNIILQKSSFIRGTIHKLSLCILILPML